MRSTGSAQSSGAGIRSRPRERWAHRASDYFVAAGPVSRILSARLLLRDGHSSGPRITAGLKRPTRRLWRTGPARAPGKAEASPELPPYLVLLRVGFALPAALLPRRCALTAPFHPYRHPCGPAVCFLWHFPSNRLEPASRTLSGTLPCGVRTFLYRPRRTTATVRSSCQQLHYIRRLRTENRKLGTELLSDRPSTLRPCC